MNGRKAKRLRHAAYGDGSKRNEGRYKWEGSHLICVGKRATYQKSKKGGH